MASATKYQMFTLLGNEFTFDVDVSKLGYVKALPSLCPSVID